MKKTTEGATQITFSLTAEEVRKAVNDLLEDKRQILGSNTTFEFQSDGECKIVTMHYDSKTDIKTETIK